LLVQASVPTRRFAELECVGGGSLQLHSLVSNRLQTPHRQNELAIQGLYGKNEDWLESGTEKAPA